jgi:hypothetical protein
MLKVIGGVMLAALMFPAAALAGGGGAEPMPLIGYTDLPPYHPYYANAPFYRALPNCRLHRECAHHSFHPQLPDR